MSENDVEAETTSNAAPEFPKEDSDENDAEETGLEANPFLRDVNENTKAGMAIGNPVGADDDDGDILLYTLGGTDMAHFDIDDRTGQLKVDGDLDFEDAADVAGVGGITIGGDNVVAGDNVYYVTVTATDPSLAETEVHVLITVIRLNEAPTFAKYAPTATPQVDDNPTALTVAEDETGLDRDADLVGAQDPEYAATDSDELPDADNVNDQVDDTVDLTIEGPDKDKFTLSGSGGDGRGLAFVTTGDNAHTPDYEKQSEYSITIVAEDANTEALDRVPMTKSLDVTIKVTNVEELGTVNLSQEQLQVGVAVTAEVDDPDGDETRVRWQWYEAEAGGSGAENDPYTCPAADAQQTWEAIESAKSATYTPAESHLDDNDDGTLDDPQCLRATAEYRDAIGEDLDSTADLDESLEMAHSTPGVVEPKTSANKQPSFTKEDDDEDGTDEDGTAEAPFMRDVDENLEGEFGSPLGVDDDDDALIWKITGGDTDSFSIGRTDGQLSTKAELDHEAQSMYMIEVTVYDPSQASGSAMLMITVNDIDDPAVIADVDPDDYVENGDGLVVDLDADDEDEKDETIAWSLKDDADDELFEISDDGVLTFKDSPNFEDAKDVGGDYAGDNIYEVTVVANKGESTLSVTVTDLEEDGKVTLTQPQPQVEIQLTANLTDGDGQISSTTWQWARSSDMSEWTDIDGAKSRSYTPAIADIGSYLRATATYNDRRGDGKMASLVSENDVEAETTSNAAPEFPKEDSDEDGTDETGLEANPFLRDVNENTKAGMAIGNPVGADDDDGDILLYTLGGTDMGHFDIDERNGQLKTKGALDYEDAANTDDEYTVTVTATDPSLAPTTVTVTISVMDLNEAPTFGDNLVTKWTVPESIDTTSGITLTPAEGTAQTYSATELDQLLDSNDSPVTDTVVLSIEGADKDKFDLDMDTGALSFADDHRPNYEKQAEYSITIVAKDANTVAPNRIPMTKSLDVTVEVTNVEETGAVKLSQVQVQVGVSVTAELTDPDGGETRVRWQWYEEERTSATECPAVDASGSDDDTRCQVGDLHGRPTLTLTATAMARRRTIRALSCARRLRTGTR